MSDPQNAFQNGSVQKALFAPQSSQAGDDFDLNEIFADYFISEFNDPLNAYTSSMANYTGAAAAVALAQQQQQEAASSYLPQSGAPVIAAQSDMNDSKSPVPAGISISLPTGRGIKTAWHAGLLPNISSGGAVLQQTQAPAPITKKQKSMEQHSQAVNHQNSFGVNQQQPTKQTGELAGPASAPQPAAAAPVGTPVAGSSTHGAASSAISGRLGFSLVGGNLAVPQLNVTSAPGQQHQQKQGQPQQLASSISKSAKPGNFPLPVGVGIRLGGSGGSVVSTGQAKPGQTGAPGQFLMWGGLGGPTAGTGGGLTDKAIAERRQRNREHAKRSRVRKKFMLESLQEQVRQLQKENVQLRMLVQEKIPEHSQKIIDECCSKNPLFGDSEDGEADGDSSDAGSKEKLASYDFDLMRSLMSGQQNFVLTDPRLPDNPIVYASGGFYKLTGYSREQVLGRNCRFLQGPGTDPKAVDVIRAAVANGSDCTVCLLNYKADGTPFWNQFFVAALRDSDNSIVNFVGVQTEVEPDAGASALEDKVNSVMPLATKGEGSGDDK